MANETFSIPEPMNEPVLAYGPGSKEKKELKKRLTEMTSVTVEIPVVIDGKKYRTGDIGECRCPHDHSVLLAKYHKMTPKLAKKAVQTAIKARKEWAALPWEARVSIFLRMADLLAGPWRQTLNAATMLGQSKTPFQAEIDAACELIDFWRFNALYIQELLDNHPDSAPGMWNRFEYRPLEGFILAITPFNFTSIAGNLPTAPAMVGTTVLWKCARSGVFPAYYLTKLFEEAGLPDGVITLMLGAGNVISPPALNSPHFGGIHFTGSTDTFNRLWTDIVGNIDKYRTYPRIVGETGGKDFVVVHNTADADQVSTALVRGAFEYQGQKCSAASRAYIPKSLWNPIWKKMEEQIRSIRMGDPTDFRNFMCAVIDKAAYTNIKSYIDWAAKDKRSKVLIGGKCDDRKGWYIEPTVIKTTDPRSKTMVEEIFGPVLTVHVYDDKKYLQTLKLCDQTSPYALTGAVFAKDRRAIVQATQELTHAAGNFYINDKPTGAVVGQQPFGGGRASGTNDKAGSFLNLLRWMSPRTIKETFVPPTDIGYPHMAEK